jgi:hypothetical protein
MKRGGGSSVEIGLPLLFCYVLLRLKPSKRNMVMLLYIFIEKSGS